MHYATHHWSDFVRGLTPERLTVRMQQHLSTGCGKCNRAANLMRKLANVASLPELDVPRAVIHNAKAIFSIPRKNSAVTAIVARLIFDSNLEPLPCGVRSRTRMFRQAMFEAGTVLVDLRLESQSDGSCMITGQVADRMSPAGPAGRVALHLVSGAERRRVHANQFGEFQSLYESDQDIRLEISGGGHKIEVPLSQVSGGVRGKTDATALDLD
jgi:hypothetical protein